MKFLAEWKAALRHSKDLQLDLSNIRADVAAALRDAAKNKYRIEETDIRLTNLEIQLKDIVEKARRFFK